MLSGNALVRLVAALSSRDAGNETASAINNGASLLAQAGFMLANVIVATSTSQTVDFGALAIGDYIFHVPASAGNSQFVQCKNAAASQTVAYNGGTVTGAQTVVVGGHSVSFTAVDSDAHATVLAAIIAINLVSSVTALVTPSESPSGTLVLTAVTSGTAGNAITLTATGTGATAGGATLAGGLQAGVLPVAAVSGDLYVVFRALAAPKAITATTQVAYF